ncbi:MAG: MotA/TolQ/ExbB proton channel family protein [Deltaproteobacteria bacterium]|nr:MotA/TolQ/ExbB proton channel family protein [Deltaproteobacteria bacterium]
MKRFLNGALFLALAAPLAVAGGVHAQEAKAPAKEPTQAQTAASGAASLDALLQQTRTARQREAQVNAEREREFKAARDQQAGLLAKAIADRDAAEARSQELSKQFDANELRMSELQTMLRAREGNLGELFGVTRQVAGDIATMLPLSLTSAQYPDREEFLNKIASSRSLPSIEELQQLWFEMQREMTAGGQVARFTTKVVEPDGAANDKEVVRVGTFTAISDGRYLNYLPAVESLAVLSRQPTSKLTNAAEGVQATTEGYSAGFIDPSRGALLALYVERPTVMERIEHGELVGYVIIAVGLIGLLVAVYQFFYLLKERMAVNNQLKHLEQPTPSNPLGRVLLAFKGDASTIDESADVAELRISEAVLREIPKLERFQPFLRLAVAAGPLLGLIGTVIGMIITFQSITESGSSDPKLMATGIGQAMIATVLGLGIAIPLLFINAGLATMSRQIVQVLDEQSTGLLAESIEAKRGGAKRGVA